MWELLWTSDLFHHKVAIFRDNELWDLRIEEKDKIVRNGFYLAKKEKEHFLLLSSGEKVFCSEAFPDGQEKIVQVLQEEREEKLAQVSQKLEMSNPYFVFFPYGKGIFLSKKMEEEQERKRLREIFQKYEEKGSFLIRTEAKGILERNLEQEIQQVLKEWQLVQERAFHLKKKGNLRSAVVWMEEILEEYGKQDWKTCYCENFELKETLKEKLTFYQKQVREYHGEISLWKQRKLEEQIRVLCQEKIDLASGGYLWIESTRACVTIDVNSGAGSPRRSNIEAAREIPRQVKLRNLAGNIVIDFINCKNVEEKKEIVSILKEGFLRDQHFIQWGNFHDFDLFLFSRQRKGKELSFYYSEESLFYQVQCLEEECNDLLEQKEKILLIEGEKNILQEWKKQTQCGIKDSIDFQYRKEEKESKKFHIEIK